MAAYWLISAAGSCQGLPVTLKAPRNSNLPEEFEVRGELYMNSRDFEAVRMILSVIYK